MLRKLIFLLIIFCIPNLGFTQVLGKMVESRISYGERGNYIFLLDEEYILANNKMYNPYINGRFFVVERSQNNIDYEEIGEVKPVQNKIEFEEIYGEGSMNLFLQDTVIFKGMDEARLLAFFQDASNDFQQLYLRPIELFEATGKLWIDETAEIGKKYYYRVKWNDSQKEILRDSVQTGKRNETLDQIKLNYDQMSSKSIDSLVSGSWNMLNVPNRMTYSFDIYGKKTFETNYQYIKRTRPFYRNDTLSAGVFHIVKPMEVWQVYLVPVDIIGNRGIPSDTATIAAMSKASLPFVENFSAKDSLDGIRLSWDPLPAHSYLSGYLLSKEISGRIFEIMDTLSLNTTSYIDYQVENGQQYNYEIQPLAAPVNNLKYKDFTGVRAAGTHNTNERLLPPENLILQQEGEHIRVSWTPVDSTNLNSYILYTAIENDPEKLTTLVTVTDTTFLDTTDYRDFNFRNRYYAVKSMGINLKMSQHSPIFSIKPNVEVKVAVPEGLVVRKFGDDVKISWTPHFHDEQTIRGYKVYRRSESSDFVSINDTIIVNTEYIDRTELDTLQYEYALSAVSISGFESSLSTGFIYEPETDYKKLYKAKFTRVKYRNVPPAIEISWLLPQNSSISRVVIYRTLANQENSDIEYKKLAEVDKNKRRFWDHTVEDNTTYIYAVAGIDSAGQEHQQEFVNIITREKVQ